MGRTKTRRRHLEELEEEERMKEAREKIVKLRQLKSSRKSSFTRLKHKLLELAEASSTDKEQYASLKQKFVEQQNKLEETYSQLVTEYGNVKDTDQQEKIMNEMEEFNAEFDRVMDEAHSEVSGSRRSVSVPPRSMERPNERVKSWFSSGMSTKDRKDREPKADDESKRRIGQDLWKQLKRVSIPVFNGDKKNFESWKAAFQACIDQAPATPEYKLLQL